MFGCPSFSPVGFSTALVGFSSRFRAFISSFLGIRNTLAFVVCRRSLVEPIAEGCPSHTAERCSSHCSEGYFSLLASLVFCHRRLILVGIDKSAFASIGVLASPDKMR